MQPVARLMQADDIGPLTRRFAEPWKVRGTRRRYEVYCREHQAGQRVVLIGLCNTELAGYVNILWRAQYLYFRDAGIAELNDLVVAKAYRRQGVALALMQEAERQLTVAGRATVGLGCGVTAYYNAARRLYARLGYVPDGRGAQKTPWGRIIYMTKPLPVAARMEA